MLLIILSWIYISFIFFGFGIGVTALFHRFAQRDDVPGPAAPHLSVLLILGMIGVAVVASVLSLLMPLGMLANGIVLLMAIILVALFKRNARAARAQLRYEMDSVPRLLIIIFAAFVLVFAFLCAQPPSHFDEGLYYGTTIKWMEEHGTVKGLANVNTRIGFNSTWFVLNALFSFQYFNLGNFNDLNGLLLLYVFSYSFGAIDRLYRRDYRLSVIVRALIVIPIAAFHFGASSDFILFNINFLSSPTADIPVCVMLWLVLAWLLELDELPKHEFDQRVFTIIAVAAFLFIVKPSAAPVLFVCVYLFFHYVFKRRFLHAGLITALALLIVAPWLTRNIFVSGYLVFPFSAIDVINADWKIPIQHAKWHENAVRVFAIDAEYDLNKPFTQTLAQWFPGWFGRLSFIQSLIFIFSCASAVILFIIFTVRSLRERGRFMAANKYFVLATIIAVAGSIFWFMKGPDPRLGYGFTAMLVMLLLAVTLRYFLDRDVRYAGWFITLFLLFIVASYYKNTFKEITSSGWKKAPPDRRLPESMEKVALPNGIIMNVVPSQNLWYAPLPAADRNEFATIQPVPRGKKISEGFKSSEKK
jgi:hypothetical protein